MSELLKQFYRQPARLEIMIPRHFDRYHGYNTTVRKAANILVAELAGVGIIPSQLESIEELSDKNIYNVATSRLEGIQHSSVDIVPKGAMQIMKGASAFCDLLFPLPDIGYYRKDEVVSGKLLEELFFALQKSSIPAVFVTFLLNISEVIPDAMHISDAQMNIIDIYAQQYNR